MTTLTHSAINQYADGRELLSATLIERELLLRRLERFAKSPQGTGSTGSIIGFDLSKARALLFELSLITDKIDSLVVLVDGYAEKCGMPRVEIMEAMPT